MIDVKSQLEGIEKLMKLMRKHKIDEVSLDYINIKISNHDKTKKPKIPKSTPKEILDKHTNDPLTEIVSNRIAEIENWMNEGEK